MRETHTSEPLAIVGVGCRFPGAHDLKAFENLLLRGACAIAELPGHRFDQARYYDPEPGAYGKSYSRLGGTIEDGSFDYEAFGLPSEVASSRDRAYLWTLEVARDTFAHAGLEPDFLRGSDTAVILGHARGSMTSVDAAFATGAEELLSPLASIPSLAGLTPDARAAIRSRAIERIRARYPDTHEAFLPGTTTSALAGLIGRVYGLMGRHMVVDAACASSLAALAIGCRALRNGTVDRVLAGGVSFSQEASVILFAQSRALSAHGSFPFDARADGFISSDGIGMVLLERLSDALAAGRRIYGVLRGIGASCDGKGKGMWAPRKEGQVLAIERALASAGVAPAELSYVEAHGTSTRLGDATELAALGETFAPVLPRGVRLPIGSVKGNIGHTREAAGVAGLIKTLIGLETEKIAPSVGFENPSPDIPWDEIPFDVVRETRPWPRGDRPRLAAIDSFGIGGINYEAIVEEAPERPSRSRRSRQGRGAEAARTAPAPVAVVGLGALFAGVRSARELWERLCAKYQGVRDVPKARWSSDIYHAPGEPSPFRTLSKRGGFLDDYRPDWKRYRIPPALVESNDPLQFMLLDAATEALADAGIDLESTDRRRIGVVIGTEFGSDYALALTLSIRVPELSETVGELLDDPSLSPEDRHRALAELEEAVRDRLPRISEDSSGSLSSSTLASRVAKTLDLNGLAFAVDASSASSLASLELACEILASGECDVVLCGGGDRSLRVQRFVAASREGALSPDASYTPFGEASGYHLGEGAGVLVLMRLGDAQTQGRHVYSVVRAVGSASDGELLETERPSATGLERAMRKALLASGEAPAEVGYVEVHGAATKQSDAVELQALSLTGYEDDRKAPLLLGSVKSNVGHCQGAAGAASLLKVSLALRHALLPPTAGIDGASHAPREVLEVSSELAPLPRTATGSRAAVTAIGAGGIYYHALLQEPPESQPLPGGAREPFVLRGRSREELAATLERLIAGSSSPPEPGTTMGHGSLCLAVQASEDLAERLSVAKRLLQSGHRLGADPATLSQGLALVEQALDPKLCFLFAGQGSQYPGMLRELAEVYPEAARALGEIDRILVDLGQPRISRAIWSRPDELGGILATQLGVLAGDLMTYAVARAHGLAPDLVTGHSYGDYPALVAAGGLSLEDAVRLTVARCEAIESFAAPGGMAALFVEADRAEEYLRDLPGAAFASNINSRDQITISGEPAALEALLERSARAGLECRRLAVPAPFHCPLMASAVERLGQAVQEVTFREPSIPFLSSVGARQLRAPADLRRAFTEQLVEPVNFVAQIEGLHAEGYRRFLEIGPASTLTRLTASILEGRPAVVVSLDNKKAPGVPALERALLALRASEPGEEAEQDAVALMAAAPGSTLAGDALFSEEEWRALRAHPGFEAVWPATRGAVRLLVQGLLGTGAEALPEGALGTPTPGAIAFHDATEARRDGTAEPSGAAVSPEPRVAAPPSADGELSETVRSYLLEQVIERTGYPADLVQFDQDMEADLGIDTVKQAQIFGNVRERFDLRTDDKLSLRDFPTLGHVLEFVVTQLEAAPPQEIEATAPDASREVVPSIPATGNHEGGEEASPPPARDALPSPPSRNVQEAPPVLRLTGSSFAMGLEHGRALSEAIRGILEGYEAFIGEEGTRRSELQEALQHPERFFDEIALEEIRGIAEGSGLPYRHFLAYNLDSALFPEYSAGCVQLGLVQRTSGDDSCPRLIHAFNEDSPLSLHVKGKVHCVVQVRQPDAGHAHVLFTQPGRIGAVSGLNATGLVVSSSVLLDRSEPGQHRDAPLHPILVRRLLQECSSTDEAVKLARDAKRNGAWSILMSHAREAKLRRFDYDGEAILASAEVDRYLVSNHSLGDAGPKAPEHSLNRFRRLEELLDRDAIFDRDAIREILRDRFDVGRGREVAHRTMNTIHRVDNVMGLVVEPARGLFSLGRTTTEGEDSPWREIRFDELFAAAGPAPRETTLVDIAPADLPPARRPSVRPRVMTRYVLRSEAELLSPSPPRYRPERLAILGAGPLAEALATVLRERGTTTEILSLEAEPAALASRIEASMAEGPCPHLCLLPAFDGAGASPKGGLVALAEAWGPRRTRVLEGPYAAVQAWGRRVPPGERVTLSAVTAMGGLLGAGNFGACLPEGGAVLGLLKALRLERPDLRIKAIDVEPSESPDRVARAWIGELDSESERLEVGFFRGERRTLRLVPWPVRFEPSLFGALTEIRSCLLTGGARGITAKLARRLAEIGVRRFHLLGRTELDPRVEEWRELDDEGRERLRESQLDALRRSGAQVTPLDWKRVLDPVDKALEIDASLRALRELGAEVDYHAVDVADAGALGSVLKRVRDASGPIEAIVHGAGVERSAALSSKSLAELRATLGAKVDGALNLIALTRTDPLRFFVGFSSVSGRFGGPGQTDYAMASEMLARLLGVLSRERPECRTITIDWPAWDEVGMAARETIKERLIGSGQKLMPVAEGCEHFVTELASPDLGPEVVFAARMDAIDKDRLLPGADTLRALARARAGAQRLPLVDGVLEASPEQVATECRLDASRDVFLLDHRMGPHPILPAVVGLELLAETASLLTPPGTAVWLSQVAIETPLKLAPDERIGLRCLAQASEAGVTLRLEVDPVGKNGRLLETGRVLLRGRAEAAELEPRSFLPLEREGLLRRVDVIYPETWSRDPRAQSMYHGPAFRGLSAVEVSRGERHLAEIVAPRSGALRPGRPDHWLLPAATLDNCLQACGVVSRARLGVLALPMRFGRIRVGRMPLPGERCRAIITLLGRSSDEVQFDVCLLGGNGDLLVELEDYGAKVLGADRPESSTYGRRVS